MGLECRQIPYYRRNVIIKNEPNGTVCMIDLLEKQCAKHPSLPLSKEGGGGDFRINSIFRLEKAFTKIEIDLEQDEPVT